MPPAALSYHPHAPEPQYQLHARLTRFNLARLQPSLLNADWQDELKAEESLRFDEGHFVERERLRIMPMVTDVPTDASAFLHWFEGLRETGPGQKDPLFPWLASHATLAQMRWFLTQEAAGEAGFDDLVALTQIGFPVRAKLEMARNYWDEMGRGHERGMHGLMLKAVVRELYLDPSPATTVWESLSLANLMVALAVNRRYAYHAVGALGVIEMTAPGRVAQVNEGLKRLDVPASARTYFQLHAGLDVKHSRAWNDEVIFSIVEAHPEAALPIAEGALMRLAAGARCFRRYRENFNLDDGLESSAPRAQVERASIP